MWTKYPVRRTQAIAPFGVGALVDFPGPLSLIHASLDAWPFKESEEGFNQFKITDEPRLARRLGVDFFVEPPDFREPDENADTPDDGVAYLRLPFLRFPLWHVCPRCGLMEVARYHDAVAPMCKGPISTGKKAGGMHSSRRMVQVRFVAACKRGHLQDFPWLEWIFKGHPDRFDSTTMRLRMKMKGSASLAGVEVVVESKTDPNAGPLQRRTLAGAFEGDPQTDDPTALSKVNARCSGHNPVLAIPGPRRDAPGCGEHLYPLLRGASNLYFARTVSSIYIPEGLDTGLSSQVLEALDDQRVVEGLLQRATESPDGIVSEQLARNAVKVARPDLLEGLNLAELVKATNNSLLREHFLGDQRARVALDQLRRTRPGATLQEIVREILGLRFPDWAIDPAALAAQLEAVGAHNEQGTTDAQTSEHTIEQTHRKHEYDVLCRDIDEGQPRKNLLIRSKDIALYGGAVNEFFDRVSQIHKLRETRAFTGFSRIFPDDAVEQAERWALISSAPKRWLPATVVRGEGIFLRLRQSRLRDWGEANKDVLAGRIRQMNEALRSVRERRHQEFVPVSPKFVLLHSLAHVLINQLVYQCGYGSASLRERIYCSDNKSSMDGLLIYTAAGDAEGSMGGLVRMAEPGRLEPVLEGALASASWCSSDPVCIESSAQGPDNCNMAACHACGLLPETACEHQNRLLDRAMLIGTLEKPDIGLFSRRI